jgi:hypothetical protein
MKKLIIAVTLLFSIGSANACDICGCGVGNYYIGILPAFTKGFIGVRYQFKSFDTRIAGDPTQFSKDFYQSVELWGGWNIKKKWQVLVFVPYNFSHQQSDDGTNSHQGMGDLSTLLNYKLIDKASLSGSNKLITQKLWIGAGIKLPTGSFSVDPLASDLAASANTQIGSGSTDFMASANYNVQFNKIGINTSIIYKINTDNKDAYRFGNKYTVNSIAYYRPKASGKLNLSPNLGVLYEHAAINRLQGKQVSQTGGWLALASAGLEWGLGKMAIGANIQLPLAQNFANGQTQSKLRGMLHVSYSF